MSSSEWQGELSGEEALKLAKLAEAATLARSVEGFAEAMLPIVASMAHSPSAFLYLVDPQMGTCRFFPYGFEQATAPRIEEACAEHFEQLPGEAGPNRVRVADPGFYGVTGRLESYALRDDHDCIGLMGVVWQEKAGPAFQELWDRAVRLVGNVASALGERTRSERELAHLGTYQTVSSMLTQSLGLHELLEAALYCSMEAVSAEAASVLLLDDEKKNFSFYQVEGPASPVLMTATFPADKGLAGSVLQNEQSEVINDVRGDRRFYDRIDSESGFQTRNMIAVPLVAGEEPVGVLEVLNKADGGAFTEDEHLLLLSIAEEIAFGIRNAKVFEYVASTYCRQRQGYGSCKGCQRPLGSWTPCVKYRETGV